MDTEQKLGEVINTLLEKTLDRRLAWASTPLSSAYKVAFPQHSITVRRIGSGTLPQYSVTLMNSAGEEIKSFTSTMPRDDYYPTLEKIFCRARRQATAADEAIAQIQTELAQV